MEIVIDKSFLDGAPTDQMRRLGADYRILFPEPLLFELMTTKKESQKRCFSKLPEGANPVALIPSVGVLLRYELESRTPCTPLIERAIDEKFKFNQALREGSYAIEGDVKQSLLEWEQRVKRDTESFLMRCSVVHQYFPELNGIEYKKFPAAISESRIKAAKDHGFIKRVYRTLLEERGENNLTNAPSPDRIDARWAFFRRVQCQLLAALRMFGKHQGKFVFPASQGVFIKAEHTIHDIEYTILATLSGALASYDKDIVDDFYLACPEGILVKREDERKISDQSTQT